MISKSYITVRYAETDQMGIVHHSVYPIWFEVARTDFIKKLGMTYSQIEKAGILLPVAELQCKYISPTYYEDELTIEVSVKDLTAARIEFAYAVYRYGEDKPIATGSSLHAWTDTKKRIINMKRTHNDIYSKIEEVVRSTPKR